MPKPTLTAPPAVTPNKYGGDPAAFDAAMQADLAWLHDHWVVDAQDTVDYVESTVAGVAADAAATAADRVQTGLDRTQTVLDRVATGADVVAATAQAANAIANAATAATKAAAADASANNTATAVIAQLTAIKTQTETARDAALAGLGAADNSQLLSSLAGQDAYAIDIAGQLVQELAGLPAGVEAIANFVAEIMDLVGVAARQSSSGVQIVPTPANASARGSPGEWALDSGFIYVCTALNTWKRVAIATW